MANNNSPRCVSRIRAILKTLFLPTHGWQANDSLLSLACLSSVCQSSSVTFEHCSQMAIDRLMISSQADRASIMGTSGTRQNQNRSSRFRAAADLVDPPVFRAANIGSSLKTVRVRPMKHYWQGGVRLAESANKLILGDLEVKIERRVVTLAPRPKVPCYKNVHCCPLSKMHRDLLPWMASWGSSEGHGCENRMWRLVGGRWMHACHRTPILIRWPWAARRWL